MALSYVGKIEQEIKELPPEYLPVLFNLVQDFKQAIQLKTNTDSLRQGLTDALRGDIQPIASLWDNIDEVN